MKTKIESVTTSNNKLSMSQNTLNNGSISKQYETNVDTHLYKI